MFESTTALPHLLPPSHYWQESVYQRESACIMRDSWHVVATTSELAQDGDFVTVAIAGIPVHIRNFQGELRALSNVCAHRHALIASESCGNSPTMRCQYHGWEYKRDGSTGRIPQPKNFMPFDREKTRLPVYTVETCGQLVFVNLSESRGGLKQFLGEDYFLFLAERFGMTWRPSLSWNPGYSANWKVPIENSLESYHVPNVHPNTFRHDPGSEASHQLHERRTSMGTSLPFSPHNRLDETFQRLEGQFVGWMGFDVTRKYEQHHVFPNLLFSFTDAISLVQCVLPSGPRTCSAVVRQFGRQPRHTSLVRGGFARLWGRLTASITRRILVEDQSMFEAIQSGLESSPHQNGYQGVLGICEERIHRFQRFVESKIYD